MFQSAMRNPLSFVYQKMVFFSKTTFVDLRRSGINILIMTSSDDVARNAVADLQQKLHSGFTKERSIEDIINSEGLQTLSASFEAYISVRYKESATFAFWSSYKVGKKFGILFHNVFHVLEESFCTNLIHHVCILFKLIRHIRK